MALLMDFRPLKESSAFRRLWAGTGLSAIGSQMTTFAVAPQTRGRGHRRLRPGPQPVGRAETLAGAADAISVVFRTTMVQLATPDRQPRYRAASTPGNAWNVRPSRCLLQLHSSAKGAKGAVR
jgi:hypothetical protein